MSFGSGGGGFSFGSNNNNQSGGFGGFGSNTSNTGGFGSNTSNTGGFGSSTAASNPFGGSTFGSNTGGFSSSTPASGSLFGSKPASNPFGSTTSNTGSGLFGSSNTTAGGFGSGSGFGSNNNTNNAFGSNTGSSGFSFANTAKPAFGSTTSSTPLFGQGGAGTTNTFGSSSSPFGAAGSGTALNQQVPPSDGTASTPYAPTLEKEAAGSSSNYQSINFMQPYQKYSFEELRLADYNAGRQFGNSTGQAGGFGSNTFGAFGSGNTGFGSNTNTNSNPFGATTTSSSGFGNNTSTTGFGGGGLFGSKPASGGLFGAQSSSAPAGGLFGTSNNTTTNAFGTGSTGFGSTNTGGGGGGLFGNTQNQQKPSLFGNNTNSNTGSAFSFGNSNTATTNTGGGLFGNNNASNTNAFGGNQQQSGGLFGNNNTTQQKPSLFGNTGAGFGSSTSQTQPSGGLFGNNTNTNTGGGLFGNSTNTTTNTGGGLFGNNTNTNTSGGLFGNTANNQQKPGGLFGGNTFGNNTTSNTSGGLFGNSGNQQQSGGLFGNTSNNAGSAFSFGNNVNKPATTSLFGNSTNQQQSGFGGSLFAPASSTQQNQQQSEFKVSSLNDPNPYGQTSIWTGLPVPTPDNSKPLFTPLSATQKLKESQSKPPPSLRLNQSRYMTPPRRSGFGFSYSTYGTPNSAASTPGGSGLSGSMYGSRSFNGGSFGRSFGKSASVSNLRSHFNADSNSVLSPDAFAPSNTRWSSGNIRRLTIDRSIRNDLFSRPSLPAFPTNSIESSTNGTTTPAITNGESSLGPEQGNKLKKRVSFDNNTTGGQNGASPDRAGALTIVDGEEDDREASRTPTGSSTPEADLVRGNELAVVPEDRESDDLISRKVNVQAKPDPQPGDYWMKPTRAELSKLPRDKLTRFTEFEVGRKGCGKVVFNDPVDLTSVPLDDLYEKIVEIRLRSITVYPDPSTKPPPGKGLNVPSTLSIENSWPRARGQPSSVTSGPLFDKHISRLKRMEGTEFINYDVSTGVWTFRVPHYTRYALDYDDDELDMDQDQLSTPPDSLNSSVRADNSGMDVDTEEQDDYEDDGDDTFAFKQKTLPGGYGRQSAIDYDSDLPTTQDLEDGHAESDMENEMDPEDDNEVSMVGSYPQPAVTKPILKSSTMGTPGKALINIDGDWAEQLERTISPRKQNRDALREVQSKVLLDRVYEPMKPTSDSMKKSVNKREFRTSIDIMQSLFNRHEERMADMKGRTGKAQTAPDFELPYAKRPKTFDEQVDAMELNENDKLWHANFKPHFTTTNKIIYKSKSTSAESGWTTKVLATGGGSNEVVVTGLQTPSIGNVTMDAKSLLSHSEVSLHENIPLIKHVAVPFSRLKADLIQQESTVEELDIYELLHVLFDEYEDEFTRGLSRQQQREFHSRIYKDRLSKYLSDLIWRRHGDRIKSASKADAATAAIMQLTARNVHAACDALTGERDFHLSLLVAQIEQADATFQEDIATQISDWRGQGVISEMSEEIRALYEILAGNTSIVQGRQLNVPVEDRATTFAISEKFGLEWIQAFALSLWYGKQKNGDLSEVVSDFQEKLMSKVESATPIDSNGYEDPLWVVLKLFATNVAKGKGAKAGANTPEVPKPVLPEALSMLSHPWDSQKAFRLHHAIAANLPGVSIDQMKVDDLAMSLAFEHSSRGNIVAAVYALGHLSRPNERAAQLKHLLNCHGASLPSAPSAQTQPQSSARWTALVNSFKIPTAWIYRAKALYARACNESLAELHYLILATDYAQAHQCLLRRVAPRLVIDEDWKTLGEVLAKFGDNATEKVDSTVTIPGEERDNGPEWRSGGQVYADFVELMALMDPSSASRRSSSGGDNVEQTRKKKAALLSRLQVSLTALNDRFEATAPATHSASAAARLDLNKDREKLSERVALCEMGKAVASVIESAVGEGGLREKQSIIDLPLTADSRLVHARTLGVDYYRGVMAMAR